MIFLKKGKLGLHILRISSVASPVFYAFVRCLESSFKQLLFTVGTGRMVYKYCFFLYPYCCGLNKLPL